MKDFFERKKEELGVSLNDVQKQAVMHKEHPLLLLAVPGSGKTTTMIMRVGYLVEEMNIQASRILAVTFSKASAVDMQERFDKFFPAFKGDKPRFSTIHSLCFSIVRDYMVKTNQTYLMIDGRVDDISIQKQSILGRLYRKYTGEYISEERKSELNTWISFIKNRVLSDEEIEKITEEFDELLPLYKEYEKFKSTHMPRLVDYDDMLTIANQALKEDEDLRTKYQNKYDHVLTDESQDTSVVQFEIIDQLAAPKFNLFVVGDDDQSIYSWRGGALEHLLNFETIYESSKVLFMEQNYRSSQRVVNTSNQFIKRNKDRFNKEMFTENATGTDVVLHRTDTYLEQLQYIVDDVKKTKNHKELAILFCNQHSVVPLIHLLDKEGIPFYQKDENNFFFSHFILQDVRNYFRLAYVDTVQHRQLLVDVLQRFRGYLKKSDLDRLDHYPTDYNLWDAILEDTALKPYQKEYIRKVKRTLPKLKDMSARAALMTLLYELDYFKALESHAKFTKKKMTTLSDRLETIERMTEGMATIQEFFLNLDRLEQVMKDSRHNRGGDVVTLSTFHSSKGLEFDKVLMIDLQDNVIPSPLDMEKLKKDGDRLPLEEAARLFYVGMTRARKELTLIHHGHQNGASMFYRDVKKILMGTTVTVKDEKGQQVKKKVVSNVIHHIEYKENMKVQHRKFGEGVITELTNEIVTVEFPVGIKRLGRGHCLQTGTLQEVKSS